MSWNIPIIGKQPEAYINVSNARFHFQEVSQHKILNLLSNIAINKATGPDKISAKLVKLAAQIISASIFKIKISHFCHQNFSKFLRLHTLFP
jgi:hypothetical protein